MTVSANALTSASPAVPVVTGPAAARSTRRRRWPVLLAVLLPAGAAVAALAGWRPTDWFKSGVSVGDTNRYEVGLRTFAIVLKEKGELKAAKSTDIKSEVEGRSTIISLVPEGTAVKEGDLLVELASDQIDDRIRQEELKEANAITAFESAKSELDIQRDKNASEIRKAELQIELKGLELDRYEKGEWDQKLRDAKVAIEEAEISLDRRKQEFEAAKQLNERNFITETEYREDEFDYLKAQWELEKARNSLLVLEKYTHVSELTQRQSDLEEAKKEADRVRKNATAEESKKSRTLEGAGKELSIIRDQLAKLRHQKEKCRIVAPTQGFVVYYGGGGGGGMRMMSGDAQIKEGAEVFERQVLMELPDTSEMMVICRIHEAKTDKLRLGQLATVEVEGVPGRRFTGKVAKIAVLADTQNRWLNPDLKEYETEILLDASEFQLKPGVTAHAEIQVQNVEDKLAVPVQSVFSKGGNRYVFKSGARRVEPVEVSLGPSGSEWVEIVKGLAEGDRIALAVTEEEKRLLPDLQGPERSGGPSGRPRMQGTPGGAPTARPAGGETPPPGGQQRAGRPDGERGRGPRSTSGASSGS